MKFSYEVPPPLAGREKVAFETVTSQGSSPVDRIVERGIEIDFSNNETNALWEVVGQLKAKRTRLFHDPKQVIIGFSFFSSIILTFLECGVVFAY